VILAGLWPETPLWIGRKERRCAMKVNRLRRPAKRSKSPPGTMSAIPGPGTNALSPERTEAATSPDGSSVHGASAIGIGGVKDIDPAVKCARNNLPDLIASKALAEIVSPDSGHRCGRSAERASFHHLSSDQAQAQLLLYSDALLPASSSDNIDDVFRNKTPNRPGGIHRKLDRSIRSQEKV